MSNPLGSVVSPTLPMTYSDLVCLEDVDPFASETTSDLQNLSQDVTHIIVETMGSNVDDPQRGIGIQNYLSGTVSSLSNLTSNIHTQLINDPRINNALANLTATGDPNNTYNLQVQVQVDAATLGLSYLVSPYGDITLQNTNGL